MTTSPEEKPRIAVTHDAGYNVDAYLQAVARAGGVPVALTPESDASMADFDGLVLSGGVDVDPARYGQSAHSETDEPDRERDDFEEHMLADALSADKPVLAICRGLQLFNVVHGGTLVQHLDDPDHRKRPPDKGAPAHDVQLSCDTRLAKALASNHVAVNSRHHQAVQQVGDGLVVSAQSSDGVVEGLERQDRRFAVAVQWHPEDMAGPDPVQSRLFQEFIAAARAVGH